jgi:hypothetical protein
MTSFLVRLHTAFHTWECLWTVRGQAGAAVEREVEGVEEVMEVLEGVKASWELAAVCAQCAGGCLVV